MLCDRDKHTWQVLKGNQGAVYGVAFSEDGTLASAGDDRTVLWNKQYFGIPWDGLSGLRDDVCALVKGNLTKEQWKALVPRAALSHDLPRLEA